MITSTVALIAAAAAAAIAAATAATTTAIAAANKNTQIKYQQAVMEQNKIAAQNEAAAKAKQVRAEAIRQNAAAKATIAATGVSGSTGSFLDLVAQGARAGEMDTLKAYYEGEKDAWSINAKIGELETQKENVGLNATLSGTSAGASTFASTYSGLSGNIVDAPKGVPTSGSGVGAAGGSAQGYTGTLPKVGK